MVSVNPASLGTGTYAVSTSASTPIQITTKAPIALRSFSIVPITSNLSVAIYIHIGKYFLSVNPPVVNTTFTLLGSAYTKDFTNGQGDYLRVESGEDIHIVIIGSGSGYVDISIDGEFLGK